MTAPEAKKRGGGRGGAGKPGASGFMRRMLGYANATPGRVAEDIRRDYGYDGDLLDIFAGNRGRLVHKWHHYIPLYDRYFAPYRNRPVRFLEIGVSQGGSLQMWRKYLGEEATIFGIDINPACAEMDGEAGQVRIGSQDDTAFLSRVVDEMGGIDVVLDDGSHHMDHVRASLAYLYPRLNPGGIYFIEDLHTAYWPKFGGGFKRKGNVFNLVRELVDDMHTWYHDRGIGHPGLGDAISGIHVHDSVIVFDKGPVHPPVHSQVK